jgi:hypothetical protein
MSSAESSLGLRIPYLVVCGVVPTISCGGQLVFLGCHGRGYWFPRSGSWPGNVIPATSHRITSAVVFSGIVIFTQAAPLPRSTSYSVRQLQADSSQARRPSRSAASLSMSRFFFTGSLSFPRSGFLRSGVGFYIGFLRSGGAPVSTIRVSLAFLRSGFLRSGVAVASAGGAARWRGRAVDPPLVRCGRQRGRCGPLAWSCGRSSVGAVRSPARAVRPAGVVVQLQRAARECFPRGPFSRSRVLV